jgi:hypothetical protein
MDNECAHAAFCRTEVLFTSTELSFALLRPVRGQEPVIAGESIFVLRWAAHAALHKRRPYIVGSTTTDLGAIEADDREQESKILGLEPGVAGDAGEHMRADLNPIVESEHIVGPASALEHLVRAGLPLDPPADSLQGTKDNLRLACAPLTHTATEKTADN